MTDKKKVKFSINWYLNKRLLQYLDIDNDLRLHLNLVKYKGSDIFHVKKSQCQFGIPAKYYKQNPSAGLKKEMEKRGKRTYKRRKLERRKPNRILFDESFTDVKIVDDCVTIAEKKVLLELD
jgi:hypothetical protein